MPNTERALPGSTPPQLTTITLGMKRPVTFTMWKSDCDKIKALFPSANLQLRNKHHAAISTRDHHGGRQDLYIRRIITDLALRQKGTPLAKGYTVDTRNGNPLDLRRGNLKVTTTRERLDEGKAPRRNGWLTHHILSIRLKALAEGVCPDEAMEAIALMWLSEQAANDNDIPSTGDA